MAGKKYSVPVKILFCIFVIGVLPCAVLPKAAEAAYAPELFISEYVEGSDNNKALEIYNGTEREVNLSGYDFSYQIQIYYDGWRSPGYTLNLSGVLKSNRTYVICHSGAGDPVKQKADLYASNLNFDGDDVIILKKISKAGSSQEVVDAIGRIGDSCPWGSGSATRDRTLVRKSSIGRGDSNPDDTFDPVLEWDLYPVDTFVYLGSHIWDDYGVDRTPPGEVSDLAVTAGDDCLRLAWTEPDDPDFAKVIISWKEAGTGAYSVAGEVYRGTTSYIIGNLAAGVTYDVKVVTVDTAGNRSSGIEASGTVASTSVAGTIYLVGPGEVARGSLFNVRVMMSNLANCYGAQAKLTFDATKARVIDADESSPGIQVAAGSVFSEVSPVFKQEILNLVEQEGARGLIAYAVAVTERVYGITGAGPYSFVEVNFQALEEADPVEIGLDLEFTRFAESPGSDSFQVVPSWESAALYVKITENPSAEPGESEEETNPVSGEDGSGKGMDSEPGDDPPGNSTKTVVRFVTGQKVVQPGEETAITSADGRITVIFPAGALPEGASVMISRIGPDHAEMVAGWRKQEFFRLEALDREGAGIGFSKIPFKITLTLPPQFPADPDFDFFFFDPVYHAWAPLFLEVPGEDNTYSVTARRFGIYALLQEKSRYFSDVPPVAWYGPPVRKLAGKNLLQGFPGGYFKPDELLTRGQAAKLVALALQVPGADEKAAFYDTQEHWAGNFVNGVAKAGLVKGYPDRSFRPDSFISRAEFVTLVVRSLKEKTGLQTNLSALPAFSDLHEGHWAARFISQAACLGLVRGYPDGTFRPGEYITRADAAVFIYNTLLLYRGC